MLGSEPAAHCSYDVRREKQQRDRHRSPLDEAQDGARAEQAGRKQEHDEHPDQSPQLAACEEMPRTQRHPSAGYAAEPRCSET